MSSGSRAMDRLTRALGQTARRRRARPGLADALVGGQPLAYAGRRLFFPLIRSLSTAFFHCLEAAAVALIFAPEFLFPLINVRLVTGLAGAALWGGTEPLRRGVRADVAADRWERARQRIARALTWSWIVAALLFALGLGWAFLLPQLPGYFSVVDAYVIAVAVRTAVNAVVRTYHSGVFALRRIYRPRWSFIGPDLVDGLGLFALWPLFGPWAVAITVVVASVVRALVTWPFVRRAYRDTALGLVRRAPLRALRTSRPGALLAVLWSAAGGLATEAHSWVVLWLWWSYPQQLALAAYGLRPLVSLILQLPRVFYVDLQSAQRSGPLALTLLRRYLRRLALGAAGLFAALLLAAALVAAGPDAAPLAALFGLFVALAALMTQQSIEALVAGRVTPLLASAALVLGPLLIDRLNPASLARFVALEGLATTCALWLLARANRRASEPAPPRPDRPLSLAHWLGELRRRRPRGRLLRLRLGEETDGRTTLRLARSIASSDRLVTVVGRREILAFESPPGQDPDQWLQRLCGLAEIDGLETAPRETGAALRVAAERSLLPAALLRALQAADPDPRAAPAVRHLSLADPQRTAKGVGTWGELSRAVKQAGRSRPAAPPLWGQWYPLAVVDGRQLAALHLVPKEAPLALRARWRAAAWQQSMRLSAGGLVAPAADVAGAGTRSACR